MEYQCTIRDRLGRLTYKYDKWYEITDDNSNLAVGIVGAVQSYGLKFLDKFQSYHDVLSHYQEVGCFPRQTAVRSHLEAALIANPIGNKNLAESLFQKAYASNHEGFRKHVAEIAKRVGYTVS